MTIRTNHVLLAATLFAMSGGLLSAQGAEAKPPTVTELIERLGDDSYKVRREAEDALRAEGSAATEELRKAAESHDDAEVKWRAKRLLRQAEGTDGPGLAPRAPGAGRDDRVPGGGRLRLGPDQDIGTRFDRLFEQLERDFGTQLPRAKFFGGDFFQDLEARMEEMRRSSTMLEQSGQGFRMSIDGDGVRLQVTEQGEGGKSDTKTYEAPDLETFRTKYPEIAERYLDGGGVRVFSFGPGVRPNLRPGTGLSPRGLVAPPRGVDALPGTDVAEDDRDRLGVYVEAVPEAVREFLDLPVGVGLRVQSVVEDSMAAQAGVEAGDILLEVAGRKVASPDDVRGALHALDGGVEFEVKVNRRGEARALHGRAPERKKAEGSADKEAASGLRKRAIR